MDTRKEVGNKQLEADVQKTYEAPRATLVPVRFEERIMACGFTPANVYCYPKWT